MGYVMCLEIDCLNAIVFTFFTLKFFIYYGASSKQILSCITFHKGGNSKEPYEDDQ